MSSHSNRISKRQRLVRICCALFVALAVWGISTSAEAGVIVSVDDFMESVTSTQTASGAGPSSNLPQFPAPVDEELARSRGHWDFTPHGSTSGSTSSASTTGFGSSSSVFAVATICEAPSLDYLGRVYAADSLRFPRPPAADLLRPPRV